MEITLKGGGSGISEICRTKGYDFIDKSLKNTENPCACLSSVQ